MHLAVVPASIVLYNDLTPLAAIPSQGMKAELVKYNLLIKEIKPASERQDADGKYTFSPLDFWRANETHVPWDLRLTHIGQSRPSLQMAPRWG